MSIFCWGSEKSVLDRGPSGHETANVPHELSWPDSPEIIQIACGGSQTLFLTADGKVYTNVVPNNNGQLDHEPPSKRRRRSTFNLISQLNRYKISQIACGAHHSVAITEGGEVFSWGSNDSGQLGNQPVVREMLYPKILTHLLHKKFIQIACGERHNLALTNNGELYAWGSNQFGQLGLGDQQNNMSDPTIVSALNGLPIAHIACGANHSFAVSKSGAVFSWGQNACGQLGLNDLINRYYPSQLKTLRSLGVRYIACGADFSVFLTNEGGVFTCGSGVHGQLGHGNLNNEMVPRMVMELMGSTVTQIACGDRHTLAFVPSCGRVYGFGCGLSGQLGTGHNVNATLPQITVGTWVNPSDSAVMRNESPNAMVVKEIFAGGNSSLLIATKYNDHIPPRDQRIYAPKTQIHQLTLNIITSCQLLRNLNPDSRAYRENECIIRSLSCWNGSFLTKVEKHMCCTSKNSGVDLNEAKVLFDALARSENESLRLFFWEKVTTELLPSLSDSPADIETLRIYLSLPLYHEFANVKHYEKLHIPFSNIIMRLRQVAKDIIKKWWTEAPAEWFGNIVRCFKNVVAYMICFKIVPLMGSNRGLYLYNQNLTTILKMLSMLYDINHLDRVDKVDYAEFNWPEMTENIDINQDYMHWIFEPDSSQKFCLCDYPFLFDAAAKTALLQTDQTIQMHTAMQNAVHQNFRFSFQESQYIFLQVSRDNLVSDTLREISSIENCNFKKPLKIKFNGEEAEDGGGVRKEFFMLVLKELLDPKYGMFKTYEESNYIWFSDLSFESADMYYLIGLICGLAIYNFTIINLRFPLALYKKLLDEKVNLTDLEILMPTVGRSMRRILEYEEHDFEEVFDLTFEISRETFGESITTLLKPNGDQISVTQENKKEFVDLYVDFIFNKAVDLNYSAFKRGFVKVCWGRVLQIFRAEELMAVVVGNEDYDWKVLEALCEYKYGYNPTDQTVKWFWEVFHELSLDQKKKFLLFLTGSDRIPIQGMKEIKIIIQATHDDRFIPVAHTCFNMLDLPRYKSKETLKYKLLQAIEHNQGFSLV